MPSSINNYIWVLGSVVYSPVSHFSSPGTWLRDLRGDCGSHDLCWELVWDDSAVEMSRGPYCRAESDEDSTFVRSLQGWLSTCSINTLNKLKVECVGKTSSSLLPSVLQIAGSALQGLLL